MQTRLFTTLVYVDKFHIMNALVLGLQKSFCVTIYAFQILVSIICKALSTAEGTLYIHYYYYYYYKSSLRCGGAGNDHSNANG